MLNSIFRRGMETDLMQISCGQKYTRISLQDVLLQCPPGNNASTGGDLLPKNGKSDKMFGALLPMCLLIFSLVCVFFLVSLIVQTKNIFLQLSVVRELWYLKEESFDFSV